jgi:hypothetical protein
MIDETTRTVSEPTGPVDADGTPDTLHTFERRMAWLMCAVAAGIVIAVTPILNYWN